MQLAMNASHAPRRYGSVARCACSKQNSSISLGAAKPGVTLISAKKVIATSTHLGFNVLAPRRGEICLWTLFAMSLVILTLFSLLATCAVASATHKRCQYEQSFCSHRCALVRDLGRLPDKAWHRCNAKCSEAFAACERRCLTRWSCGGL